MKSSIDQAIKTNLPVLWSRFIVYIIGCEQWFYKNLSKYTCVVHEDIPIFDMEQLFLTLLHKVVVFNERIPQNVYLNPLNANQMMAV